MQSAMQQPMQWLMQSPIMARWREGRRQLDICIWMPCGSLLDVFFSSFCYLLEALWHLLDAFGEAFWTQGRLLGPFWAQDGKMPEQIELWPQFGRPPESQLETILVILMTFWRLVFCCFLGAQFSHILQFRGPSGI